MINGFDLVKVFIATKAKDRDVIGEKVTEFLRSYNGTVVDRTITQSSDSRFHCFTITLFCRGNRKRRREHGRLQHQDE